MNRLWSWLGILVLASLSFFMGTFLSVFCADKADTGLMLNGSVVANGHAVVDGSVRYELPRSVPVLMYHMVADIPDNDAVIREDVLREQMAYLKEHQFHPISLWQLEQYMVYGMALPENPVCLTFDDGYIDNYEIVYPLMKAYDFPWAIFVIGTMTDIDGRVSWDHLREMVQHGVTVGNHTMTHGFLTEMNEDELRYEVMETQRLIETQLGMPVRYFCYPSGDYSPMVQDVVSAAGLTLGLTMDRGRVTVGSNPLAVRRYWVGNRIDINTFAQLVAADRIEGL